VKRLCDQLLPLGLCAWAAGATMGEGVAFAGAFVTLGVLVLRRELRFTLGVALVLAWIVFAIVTARFAVRPLGSGAPWSAANLAFFGVAWIALRGASDRTVHALCTVLAVCTAISGALCFYQHWRAFPFFEGMERMISIDRVYEPAEGGGFKAGGLHFHRLRFAHTLVPLALATVPLARKRPAVIAAFALGLVGMIFAYVGAAWVALAIGVAAYAFAAITGAHTRAALLSLTLLLLPLLLVAFASVPADRQIAWRTALALFLAHPLSGVGYGGYATAALAQMGGAPPAAHPHIYYDAHSLLLQILAEDGLMGALLLCLLAWRYAGLVRGRVTPAFVAVLAAAAALAIVHNLLFHPVVVLALALALALAGRATSAAPSSALAGGSSPPSPS
jgi:hypothetical protein